jgi:hypothetical protein
MSKGVSRGQQLIRVKTIDENGNWFTVSMHFGWEAACAAYNDTATPKMLTTKTKVIHKQFTDNGFIFNRGTDPRNFVK